MQPTEARKFSLNGGPVETSSHATPHVRTVFTEQLWHNYIESMQQEQCTAEPQTTEHIL